MTSKLSRAKPRSASTSKIRRRICRKCNRTFGDEDRQCPNCGLNVPTCALNTKEEWKRLPRRFTRGLERSHSLPLKPEGVPTPGEYNTPRVKILRGGRIESKRTKH